MDHSKITIYSSNSHDYYMEYYNVLYIYEGGNIVAHSGDYSLDYNHLKDRYKSRYYSSLIIPKLLYPEPLHLALGKFLALDNILINL